MADRRVALIAPAGSYVGPELARLLATRGYDLVLASPPVGLADELAGLGAAVEVLGQPDDGTGLISMGAELGPALVEAAKNRFGTYHSAFFSSGRVATGRFLNSKVEDLQAAFRGNVELPYHFAQAVVPTLVEQGDGQLLVATSATALHATRNASLYAATRSAATVMLQTLGIELAPSGVQVNVVGTNFMDFPEFLRGNGVKTPEDRARVEAAVPMKRLGTMAEFAAFCAVYLDGTSRFTTGQFVRYAGGWAS